MIQEFLRYRASKKRVAKLMQANPNDLVKGFILDSRLLEAQQLSTLLGLSEVTEADIEASDNRSRRVSHLTSLVSFFAASLSNSVMSYYDTVSPFNNELSPEEKRLMEIWVAKVAVSCTLGVLAQLDELDLIEVAK